MFDLLFIGFPIPIIIFLIFRLTRRRRNNVNTIKLADTGVIMDRSLRTFQQHFVPLIALSALLLPLGLSSGGAWLWIGRYLGLGSPGLSDSDSTWFTAIVTAVGWLSIFGLGKTVLACVVAQAMQLREAGAQVSVGHVLRQLPWRSSLVLAVLMAIPYALASIFGILGTLYALNWAAAPFVMVFEGTSPYQSIKRSYKVVRPYYSGLLNTIVPLWLIGWIITGTPLLVLVMLLPQMFAITPEVMETLNTLTTIGGTVLVAPLMAVGTYQFYAYVRERDAANADLDAAIGAFSTPSLELR